MPANQEKFVTRFEKAVMQYAILNKAREGDVTKENLKNIFSGNLQMKGNHLDECLDTLVQEDHIKAEGNKYRITDDGREDVIQVQNLAVELPRLGGQTTPGGGQTQTGQQQPR